MGTQAIKFFLITFLWVSVNVYGDYLKNPYVSDEVWETVQPYFLPYSSKLRPKLDAIFKGKRVIASTESISAAGFTLTETQGTRVTAVRHKELPGYVLKIYPDNRSTRIDWVSWTNRIIGSKLLQKSIKMRKHEKIFKVPKKWIYPLDAEPSPEVVMAKGGRKNFILVVEDVKPYPRKKNWDKWRRLNNKQILKALVDNVQAVGAGDCVRANNLPWCKDGKIALVDTEVYYRWPIRYHPLIEVLNRDMRKYWKKITEGRTEKPDTIIQALSSPDLSS